MGQKSHPIGFRVGILKSWTSEWMAKDKKQSQSFFVEDVKIREMVDKYFYRSGLSKVVIRRTLKNVEILLFSAKIGLVMGKNGQKIKILENKFHKIFGKKYTIVVKNIKVPEMSARVMAEHISSQIEGRTPFRRVAKMVVGQIMQKGAMGVKIQIKGRLGGVDIARSEKFMDGRVPLQTLRTDVDYYDDVANTKYGVIGVKVRIAKGNIYEKKTKSIKNNIV